jgi:hypothetical protein
MAFIRTFFYLQNTFRGGYLLYVVNSSMIVHGIADLIRHYRHWLDLGWLDAPLSFITQAAWVSIVCVAILLEIFLFFSLAKTHRHRSRRTFIAALALTVGAFLYAIAVCVFMQMLYHKKPALLFNHIQPRYFFPSVFLTIAAVSLSLNAWRQVERHVPNPPLSSNASFQIKENIFAMEWGLVVTIMLATYLAALYIDLAVRYW